MRRNATDLLKNSAAKYPEKVALSDLSKEITYAELNGLAENMATVLAGNGTFREPILVFCDREVESVVSLWGVAYSGNFYVPIDISTPLPRIKLYLEIVKPKAAILRKKQVAKFSDSDLLDGMEVYVYDEMIHAPKDESLLRTAQNQMTMKDPLYLVFTSGSTGMPKGVLKTHRSLSSFIEEFVSLFDFNEDDIFANQASFDFDIAAKDIYTSASVGASLHIIPSICFVIPKKLTAFLHEKKANTLIWSVAAMNHVVNARVFECGMPESIKKVMFSGEVLSAKTLNEWMKNIPSAAYVNLYAPSEVTGNCLYHAAEHILREDERLPLGTPFPNAKILLLKENQEEAKDGELGEIYVAGEFLASGYYNAKELTEKAFVQNPLHDRYPEIVYKTGDLARFVDGKLFFVSRKDDQIKHMGHRIELGEIEALVNEIPSVDRGNCFLDPVKHQLVLTVCGKNIDVEQIKEHLRGRLPKYMLPHQIVELDHFPLTPRGKPDRAQIKELYERSLERAR